jgi:pimeloyl-ACP methyl ester carboxylesterase
MTTYALIHGAGDVGWYWHLVEAELRRQGHEAISMDLPIEDDSAGLLEYARAVVTAIGSRRDPVVVAQSFGGYVAPIVCAQIPARLMVLIAGMVPAPGESAEEMFANTGYRPDRREDASEIEVFYQDVPPALAREAIARGRRQSETPGSSPGRSPPGPRCRRDSCSVATIGCSRRPGSARWSVTASASRQTRSTAATRPPSVGRWTWPSDWRATELQRLAEGGEAVHQRALTAWRNPVTLVTPASP